MRCLVPLLLAPLLVLGGAQPATAEVSTGEVAAALQRSPVFQEPGVDLVDVPTLVSELTRDAPRVVVAVLASAPTDASAGALATAIGGGLLDTDVVVLVVTADQRYGAATGRAAALRGVDARVALAAERDSVADAPFGRDTVTALVTSFAQRVAGQAATDRSIPQPSEEGGFPLVPVLLLVGLGVLGAVVLRSSRRRRDGAVRVLRTEVEALHRGLAGDLAGLEPGDDAVVQRAVADAKERYAAAEVLLRRAGTREQLQEARLTVLEGLHAAGTAREALGLEPGRKHWFGGGRVKDQDVPAGWYPVAFWAPLLVGPLVVGDDSPDCGPDGEDLGEDLGGDVGGDVGGDLGMGDLGMGDLGGGC